MKERRCSILSMSVITTVYCDDVSKVHQSDRCKNTDNKVGGTCSSQEDQHKTVLFI